MSGPSLPEIAVALRRCRPAWLPMVFPAGRSVSGMYLLGDPQGAAGDSLPIPLDGRQPKLRDFASGWHGDDLDLWAAGTGQSLGKAAGDAACWLGLVSDPAPDRPPRSAPRPQHAPEPADGPGDDAGARIARALDLWCSAGPLAGSPGCRYLRGRGLDPARLPTDPPGWPESLRWHPDADGRGNGAIVAAVNHHETGLVCAVHRIFVRPDGTPLRDDAGQKIKLALGPIGGHCIRHTWWQDPGRRWGLAEGVETSLAATMLTSIPTASAINAGNLSRVRPPAWCRSITIWADNDASGTGLREAAKAKATFAALPQIESVRVAITDRLGADMADLIDGGAHAA